LVMIMPDLRSQKNIAARIMKCGTTRVWMDPARSADIAEAITAADVRKLISDGVIRKLQKIGNSSFRKNYIAAQKKKGRRRGTGSKKGKKKAKMPKKAQWMTRIRSIRRLITQLKTEKRIDAKAYRDVYVKAKSGVFRSKAHVMIYLERNNLLREKK
jgi:large subunit ribosomal protein L19e